MCLLCSIHLCRADKELIQMETAWCPNLVGFGIRAARQTLVSAAAAIKLPTTAGENGAGNARETLHQSSVIYWGAAAKRSQQKDGKVFSAASLSLLCHLVEDLACIQTDGRRDEG